MRSKELIFINTINKYCFFFYFFGFISIMNDNTSILLKLYLCLTLFLSIKFSLFFFDKTTNYDKEKNDTKFLDLIISIISIFSLFLILNSILDYKLWLEPGAIKYKNYANRNGINFAIIMFLIPYIINQHTGKNVKNIFLFFCFILVFLCLGRNPALTYIILILFNLFRDSKVNTLNLNILFIFGIFFYVLANSFRAAGLDLFSYLQEKGSLGSYFLNSSEFNVNARVFEYVHLNETTLKKYFSYADMFQPLLGLYPVEKFCSLFDLSCRGTHFARFVGNIFPTTGGGSIMIEYYFYFKYLAFPIMFLTFSILFYFTRKILKDYSIIVMIISYVVINSYRIDLTTLINFLFNGIVMILIFEFLSYLFSFKK